MLAGLVQIVQIAPMWKERKAERATLVVLTWKGRKAVATCCEARHGVGEASMGACSSA